MLRFLGKRNRSRNALLIFFVAILTVGLVVTFVPSLTGMFKGNASNDSAVAEVVGQKITVKELKDALVATGKQFSRMQGSSRAVDPATVYAQQGPQVLDRLIRNRLIEYEAERLNLVATDKEVRERIRQIFSPWPGPDEYRRRLRSAEYSPEQFEEELRTDLTSEKLKSYVAASAQVSNQEVEDDYRRNKTNYDYRWVEIDSEALRDKVAVNDADLRAYFDQNKNQYFVGVEQRRARYLFIDQAKAGETMSISDDELRQNFNPELGVERVKVSQIVLDIPKDGEKGEDKKNVKKAGADKSGSAAPAAQPSSPTQEDLIRAKADEIVNRAKGKDGKPAEDFVKLAQEFSQDAKTRAAGGDLGWVNKKDKRDTDDPLNRVFTMTKNEVSPPIKKGEKFYILKVTDRKIPTFEESREQLLKEAQVTKGYSKAVEIATEAEQRLKETRNAEGVATELNQKYGQAVVTVKDSVLFSADESPTDLSFGFVSSVFDAKEIGEVGDRQNVNNGFAVPQYADIREPHDPPFDEVKKKVEDQYRAMKAKNLALERARQLGKASSPDQLKPLADSLGLKIDERNGLTGTDSIGPLVSEHDRELAHALQVGQVSSEPIKISDKDSYVVVGLLKRKDPDMGAEFQKESKSIRERLLNERKQSLFSTFLETTQKRLKDEGKIQIYFDVIDEAIGSPGPGAAPGLPGGLPGGFPGGFPGQPPTPPRGPARRGPQTP